MEKLEAAGLGIVLLREERRLSSLGWHSGEEPQTPIYVENRVLGGAAFRPLQEVSLLLERYNRLFTIESLYCDPHHHARGMELLRDILEQ